MTFRSEYRSCLAADLGLDQAGRRVRLAGWVARVRDLGGISFFDLRDGSGLVQVVVDPAEVPEASELRMEFCVAVEGTVRRRPKGTENPDMDTGALEVAADRLEILSRSAPLPFMIDDRSDADEQVRLRHRYPRSPPPPAWPPTCGLAPGVSGPSGGRSTGWGSWMWRPPPWSTRPRKGRVTS